MSSANVPMNRQIKGMGFSITSTPKPSQNYIKFDSEGTLSYIRVVIKKLKTNSIPLSFVLFLIEKL